MLKPLKNRVIIKPEKIEEKTASGLIKPESAKDAPQKGVALAIGSETKTVKVGDTVLYGKYVGFEIQIDGEDHLVIDEDDILAVVN